MSHHAHTTETRRQRRAAPPKEHARTRRHKQSTMSWKPLLVGFGIMAIVGIFFIRQASSTSGSSSNGSGSAAGVQLGTRINSLESFPSSTGKTVSLNQYRGKKLVVYLYEGITCGPCQQQLESLQSDLPAIHAAGGSVLAVSVDPINMSRSAAQQMHLGFPIIEDTNHALGSALGDFHLATAGMDMGPVDNHAMFVLDNRGVVRWKDMAASTMNVSDSDVLNALKAVA